MPLIVFRKERDAIIKLRNLLSHPGKCVSDPAVQIAEAFLPEQFETIRLARAAREELFDVLRQKFCFIVFDNVLQFFVVELARRKIAITWIAADTQDVLRALARRQWRRTRHPE